MYEDGTNEEMTYIFNATAEDENTGTKGLLSVALTPADVTASANIMTEYSLSAFYYQLGCYLIQNDTTGIIGYLGLSVIEAQSCENIITALWDAYQNDPTNTDLQNFFTMLLIDNPVYLDSSLAEPFIATQAMIDNSLVAAPAGFDALNTVLTAAEILVPSDIAAIDISTYLTEAGM